MHCFLFISVCVSIVLYLYIRSHLVWDMVFLPVVIHQHGWDASV